MNFHVNDYSMGIKSVVDEKGGHSSGPRDAMCPACEMAVTWMQHQLTQNKTFGKVLDYVDGVWFL